MAFTNNHSLNDASTEKHEKRSELDLIPTKITSVEPDPLLFVTPEKKSLLKNFQKGDTASNPKVNNLISPDPELFVTPEKGPSVLKTAGRGPDNGPSTRNKVRFNIPESSSENTTSTLSPTTYNESSTLSTEFDEASSSQTTEDTSDFAMKAALYTRRNPLADITLESHHNFDCTTTDTSSSTNNSQRSFSKLFDMKGKKFTQKQTPGSSVDPVKTTVTTTKITTSKLTSGHRRNTPAQAKIDKLTAAQNSAADFWSSGDTCGETGYLRKKSGLHKHQHSIRYIDKEKEPMSGNELESPKYNTSVAAGQKLQQIKEEKFDAMQAIAAKIKGDRELKSHVAERAAAGTNVDPEEALFTNLTAVDVPLQDIATAPEFRRVKRPHLSKSPSVAEPDIMDAFPGDLVQEKMILDSRCFTLPELELQQVPSSSAMSLYEHSLSWE